MSKCIVDLVYYGNRGQLEYDFVLAPGAHPDAINLAFHGVERLEVDANGGLVLHTAGGRLLQPKPFLYQEVKGMRREIRGGYVLKDGHQVGFQVAAYDDAKPLIIDPVIDYSSYLGGDGPDLGNAIAVDDQGFVYVTGETDSVAGQNGPIAVTLTAPDSGDPGAASGCLTDLDPELLKALRRGPGAFYVNIHTEEFPEGALRGQLF